MMSWKGLEDQTVVVSVPKVGFVQNQWYCGNCITQSYFWQGAPKCQYVSVFTISFHTFFQANVFTSAHCMGHRRSQDFLCGGCTFSSPEIGWPFSNRHPVLHAHVSVQILPPTTFCYLFILSTGGAPQQIQLIFAWFQQKMPRRKFFRHPGGCICTPCTHPGYAYGVGSTSSLFRPQRNPPLWNQYFWVRLARLYS